MSAAKKLLQYYYFKNIYKSKALWWTTLIKSSATAQAVSHPSLTASLSFSYPLWISNHRRSRFTHVIIWGRGGGNEPVSSHSSKKANENGYCHCMVLVLPDTFRLKAKLKTSWPVRGPSKKTALLLLLNLHEHKDFCHLVLSVWAIWVIYMTDDMYQFQRLVLV